jgi:hypothetical protein
MYCPKCGKENVEGAQLCSACSWILSSVSTAPLPDAKTSKAAVWAIVLGILAGFTSALTTIPAIICGIIAIGKINKSRGQLKGKGLAITGIIASVAGPALTISMLLPTLSKAKMQAQQVACGSHMRQLGQAMSFYVLDNMGMHPTPSKWCDLIQPYLGQSSEKVMLCPTKKDARCTYALNKNVEKLKSRPAPPNMVLLFETTGGWNQYGEPELLTTKNHGGKGCNILFCNGDVRFVKTEDIPKLKWMPDVNARLDAAKWSQGKAMMGTIATAIRTYASKKNTHAALPTSIVGKGETELGFAEVDLISTYFKSTDFSINVTSLNPLKFTITCTSTKPNAPSYPEAITLNQDGVWTP